MPVERISRGFKDISMSFEVNPITDDIIGVAVDLDNNKIHYRIS